jgi:hypothetical protein
MKIAVFADAFAAIIVQFQLDGARRSARRRREQRGLRARAEAPHSLHTSDRIRNVRFGGVNSARGTNKKPP